MQSAKIGVIGMWHLGSVYAACLAELGHEVVGFESDGAALAKFQTGQAPLFEPGLNELLKKQLESGSLTFTNDFGRLADRDYIFITFDTPVDENDRSDIGEIIKTVERIAEIKDSPFTLVVSSQVPVGTCDTFIEIIQSKKPKIDFDVVYMPENLRLGNALEVFLKADRFVVGTNNPRTYGKMESLLKGTGAPIVRTSLKSAEVAKHALNSFLATSVSFINELADVCQAVGADITQVSEALKSDVRIGRKAFLSAGLGFAGGTLARDLITLTDIGSKKGIDLPVIEGALKTNAVRPARAVERILEVVGEGESAHVTVLGLTYKPGTSTLRRSVSLGIIRRLRQAGLEVKAYDPKADISEIAKPDFTFCPSLLEAAKGSSALIIVTGWPEFKEINYAPLLEVMSKPVILDVVNFASPESRSKAESIGFAYYGIGIGETKHET